ncbi:hypothetical protein SDC9_38196 [bioreactor metagenome]|uniref:Uncharacterized protein n=1 Tax=bioreactor metagenome TaxID=1076179 RepID=A0A644VL18_9ZZZZ
MRGQVAAHRRDRDPALEVDRRIGAGRGRGVLRAALDPEEPPPGRRMMRLDREEAVGAIALRRHLPALHRRRRHRREVDAVEDAIGAVVPDPLLPQLAQQRGAVHAGGLERVLPGAEAVRPEELAQRDCRHALQRRLHRAAERAGIKRVLGRVVAAVDAGEHQIGLASLEDIVKPRKHAIGRAALGGIAARAVLGDHHRPGVADAMADARLLEGRGDGPDLALGACKFGRKVEQNLEPRRVDAVVIGDQNAHEVPVRLVLPLLSPQGPARQATGRMHRDFREMCGHRAALLHRAGEGGSAPRCAPPEVFVPR